MDKIQILVNHYSEDADTVARFLDSVDMQTGVDVEVLVRGDGGERLPSELLSGHGFPIRYEYAEHSGVCHTRNELLDASDAPIVMFADMDDCFHADGLMTLVEALEDADVACSPFLSEHADGSVAVVENDVLHVHGKAFRRQYLVDNQIRFPDELEYGGDMSFLWLSMSLGNVAWVRDVFYTWKFNQKSITRSHHNHHMVAYKQTLRCYALLGRDLRRRGRHDLLERLVCATFAMIHVDASGDAWAACQYELAASAAAHASGYVTEFMDAYDSAGDAMRRAGYERMAGFVGADGGVRRLDGVRDTVDALASDVLIVGMGVVGRNLSRELAPLSPAAYDKYSGIGTRVRGKRYKVAFVCVDTPSTDGNPCDLTEVINAIVENDAETYVIKSTVLPGTTDALACQLGKRVVFSPEYYGGTQHCNNYEFDFTILGGERADCVEVVQVLQRVYDGRHTFRVTDARTAELAKYMENAYLATKVSFCCQFFEIAERMGVCYEELRELFVLDPRVSPSHTFVHRDHPWWGSHCLDKDVPAIAEFADASLLRAVVEYNLRSRDGHALGASPENHTDDVLIK